MSVRLTVAQAIVRFLELQYVERDGVETPFFAGCWGIFGHGNVAGVGQALLEREHAQNAGETDAQGHVLRYHQARNEQAMVHAAVGYARHRDRLAAFACSASVGPGSTNMVTGAALATINRIPVLLLPGDVFATRVANPVLQEVEDPRTLDISVNDCFKPVSRFWDRINRPEQLPLSLLAAMRVLTDPAETGAVTLSPAPGRAGRGVGLGGRPVRPAGVARVAPAAGRRRPGACGRGAAQCPAPAARRRRRGHLLRRERRAPRLRRGDRRTRGRVAGRQGQPALRPSPVGRRDRRHRHHRRRRARRRGGRGDRRRHPLQRLHHRVEDRVRRPGRPLRQPQRDVVRRPQAVGGAPGRRRPARAGAADARQSATGAHRQSTPRAPPGSRPSGTTSSSGRTTSTTSRSRPSRRCSAWSTASPATRTSWCARPAPCRATSTSSGAPATARATTSSTASPAWATRSPAGWA